VPLARSCGADRQPGLPRGTSIRTKVLPAYRSAGQRHKPAYDNESYVRSESMSGCTSFLRCRNVHDVRSFLGLVKYFCKFIEHYLEIAVPSTRKASAWAWTGRCQDSFEKLKPLLTEAPLLHTPDESLSYEVVTDALDIGLGGILLREGHPVAF
jgi:hypothetical protein